MIVSIDNYGDDDDNDDDVGDDDDDDDDDNDDDDFCGKDVSYHSCPAETTLNKSKLL